MEKLLLSVVFLAASSFSSVALASGEGDAGLRAELQNPSLIQPGYDASRVERPYGLRGPGRYTVYVHPSTRWRRVYSRR